jgi:hypothetical protein
MVRSVWVKALGAMLVGTGLVCGQQPTSAPGAPPGSGGEIVSIQEAGKPEQRCKVVRTWKTPEGHVAHEVQVLSTGEKITIVEGTPVLTPGGSKAVSTRMYHWRNGSAPPGTPLPPAPPPTRYILPTSAAAPVPAPVAGSACPCTQTTSPQGLPVVVTEVPEEHQTFGGRLRSLFHRDRTEERPVIVETTPGPTIVGSTPPPPLAGPEVKAAKPAPIQRVTASTTTPTTPTTPIPTAVPPAVAAPAVPAPVVPAPAAARAWPAAYAGQPAGGNAGTSFADNPIMSMSPPAAGAPPRMTRMVPAPQPASPCDCTPGARPVPVVKTASCDCQPTVVPVPTTGAAGSKTVVVSPGSPCCCDCSGGPVIIQGTPEEAPKGLRGRLSSLFGGKRNTDTVVAQTTVITPPAAVTPAPAPAAPTAVKPAPAKPVVEAPKETDWHQSWGKLDAGKTYMGSPPAKDASKTDVARVSTTTTTPVPPPPPPAPTVIIPSKTEMAVIKPMPAPVPPLPVADTKQPDPLRDPEKYAARPVVETKHSDPVKADGADVGVKDRTGGTYENPTNKLPIGTRSVMDAGSPQYVPVPIVTMPDYRRPPEPPAPHVPQPPVLNPKESVDVSNAFTTVSAAAPQAGPPVVANAFTPAPAPVDPTVAAHGAFGPMGQGYPMPGTYPPGYDPRMAGLSAPPGSNLMPRYAYPQVPYGPVGPTGYGPNPAATVPAAYPPAPGQGVRPIAYHEAATNYAGAQAIPSETLATLRDSIYPSQREWAAMSLVSFDWRTHPDAVHALVTAAREDPAGSVRAACVRALAQMKVDTTPVIATLQSLKTDGDPRVLHEVEAALATLKQEKMDR